MDLPEVSLSLFDGPAKLLLQSRAVKRGADERGNSFERCLGPIRELIVITGRDVETGEQPVVSYWKQALIASDNRIPAMGCDASSYTFAAPQDLGPVTVTAELRLRRAFQATMDAKSWDTPDIVMEDRTVTLETRPWRELYLPLVVR